jgi:hypothetical protein
VFGGPKLLKSLSTQISASLRHALITRTQARNLLVPLARVQAPSKSIGEHLAVTLDYGVT